MPGDYVDLSSDPGPWPKGASDGENHGSAKGENKSTGRDAHRTRQFVGVHFACCDVYSRIYINRQRTAYVGYCPRCTKRVELKIGPGGTDSRFFTAY
jgi:hypothetical protein